MKLPETQGARIISLTLITLAIAAIVIAATGAQPNPGHSLDDTRGTRLYTTSASNGFFWIMAPKASGTAPYVEAFGSGSNPATADNIIGIPDSSVSPKKVQLGTSQMLTANNPINLDVYGKILAKDDVVISKSLTVNGISTVINGLLTVNDALQALEVISQRVTAQEFCLESSCITSWPTGGGGGGTGDITGVAAGDGLTGGGDFGEVRLDVGAGTGITVEDNTVSADETYLQRRVSSTCSPGTSIRAINADGTVTCETDDSGVVSGGIGSVISARFNCSGGNTCPKTGDPSITATSTLNSSNFVNGGTMHCPDNYLAISGGAECSNNGALQKSVNKGYTSAQNNGKDWIVLCENPWGTGSDPTLVASTVSCMKVS